MKVYIFLLFFTFCSVDSVSLCCSVDSVSLCCSVDSVSLCCSVFCLCVNVYCTTATGLSTQLQLTNISNIRFNP
jgi:hypothetical protein